MKPIQRIALYLLFFSINFEVWDPFNTSGFFSISKLMGFIYLITMVPLIVSFVTRDEMKPFLRPVLFFFGLLTLINLFNINSTMHNFLDISIFQNIILFYILINHESLDQLILEKGMLSFALGSIAIALLFTAGIGIGYSPGDRVSIFGDNQNAIGIRMCISILILIFAAIQNPLQIGKIRFLLLLPIPIMVQLLVVSASRTAMLSFILAFLSGILLLKTKKLWSKIVMITIVASLFIFVWLFMMQSEVLSLRLLSSLQEGDLSGRDIIWQRILPLIKENPFFGIGTIGYANFSQTTFGMYNSPHNVFLEVLCYTGIVGLFIYLIFLYRILMKSLQLYKTKKMLLPLLLLVPVIGILASGQILSIKTGWIIFAYIAGSYVNSPKSGTVKVIENLI